jgi:hypothetical protein
MLRIASLFCNVLLAVLSLLPGRDMARAGLRGRASALRGIPNRLEHFIAYAGPRQSRWEATETDTAPLESSASTRFTPALWNICSAFRAAGALPSGTSLCRHVPLREAGQLISTMTDQLPTARTTLRT